MAKSKSYTYGLVIEGQRPIGVMFRPGSSQTPARGAIWMKRKLSDNAKIRWGGEELDLTFEGWDEQKNRCEYDGKVDEWWVKGWKYTFGYDFERGQ